MKNVDRGSGIRSQQQSLTPCFSQPLPLALTVPLVDQMQLFLRSVVRAACSVLLAASLRASSWGARPPFLPPPPRACSQATDCSQCKGCFCTNSAHPLNNNKVKLDEQHIQQMQSNANAFFFFKQEFQSKKGQFNHPSILGQSNHSKYLRNLKLE